MYIHVVLHLAGIMNVDSKTALNMTHILYTQYGARVASIQSNLVDHGTVFRGWFHGVSAGDVVKWTAPICIHSIDASTVRDQLLNALSIASGYGNVQGSLSIVIPSIYITPSLLHCMCVCVCVCVCVSVCVHVCVHVHTHHTHTCTSLLDMF